MAQYKLTSREGQEETEEERRRRKALAAVFDQLKAAGEGTAALAELLADQSAEGHAALLDAATRSHPGNGDAVAHTLSELQQRYGNAYVAQVLALMQTNTIEDSDVASGLLSAWVDSKSDSYDDRHEEGGYIVEITPGDYNVERWPAGTRNGCTPEAIDDQGKYNGHKVVGAFHTHPNPQLDENGDAWMLAPSEADINWTKARNFSSYHYVVGIYDVYRIKSDGSYSAIGERAKLIGG